MGSHSEGHFYQKNICVWDLGGGGVGWGKGGYFREGLFLRRLIIGILRYDFSYGVSFIFTFHGYITNTNKERFLIACLADAVRALHRYGRGQWVRILYKPEFLFSQLLKLRT